MRTRLVSAFTDHSARFFFGFTFLVVLICLFVGYRYFSVETIRITGTGNVKNASDYYGSFLPLLSEKDVERKLYESNYDASEIKVQKLYPRTIVISLTTSEPAAYVQLGDGYLIINTALRVIEKSQSKMEDSSVNLPEIKYYQPFFFEEYGIGEELDKADIRLAVNFASKLSEFHQKVDSIDITSPYMIVLSGTDRRYILTVEKNADIQYQQFLLIEERLKGQGQKYEQIDLRFDKPIITF